MDGFSNTTAIDTLAELPSDSEAVDLGDFNNVQSDEYLRLFDEPTGLDADRTVIFEDNGYDGYDEQ